METRAAPTIANLVMGDFETKHVYTYPSQPVLWIQFIDDNFMIWTHGSPTPPSNSLLRQISNAIPEHTKQSNQCLKLN